MPVTNIKSDWASGNLYFYESTVGRSVTGDVLQIATDAVTVGGTSQDVDFAWYASGSKSFVLDAGAGTLTMAGIDVTITGDLTIDTEDINIGDGDDLEFGDSQDVLMRFSLADASNPAFVLALDDTSQQMHITDKAAVATDWARSAGTHPELAIHSNTTPATDYLAIGNHDGTTASVDVVGGTTLAFKIAGTAEVNITASAIAPETSDGNALGSATKMWSDLFLADGAVVNFNNGNVTLTHAAASLTMAGGEFVVSGAATGVDHPINLNSITAMTGDETTECGNVIKIDRSAGAIGGTHSGIICKHYITGGDVDGTGLVSGLYVNLKYQPDTENAAAEVSLMQTHLYSNDSDAIDYGWYCLAPASKVSALLGVSGTMTNFLEVKASGAAGMTVSADGMTKNPQDTAEDGYLTIKVEGGASYQIPFYEA